MVARLPMALASRRASAGIRREHSQEPRLGIPSRGHSGHDAALRHVAANFSTPGSPAASGLSFWLGRRRPSPSRCATSRAGGGGRSCRSGCVPAHPSRGSSARRVDLRRQRIFFQLVLFSNWSQSLATQVRWSVSAAVLVILSRASTSPTASRATALSCSESCSTARGLSALNSK